MSVKNNDPVLDKLAQIDQKLDKTLENQSRMSQEINQIHDDCKQVAQKSGALAGGVAGGLVSATIMYIRAKMGV